MSTQNTHQNPQAESRNTKPSARLSRARSYCFTLNNYKCADVHYLKNLSNKLLVFQSEVGEKGTPHLQGVINFHNAKTFSAVKEILPAGCHIEKCRKLHASINYCTKKETWDGKWRYHKTGDNININIEPSEYKIEDTPSRPRFNDDGSSVPSKEWLKWCSDNFDKWLDIRNQH